LLWVSYYGLVILLFIEGFLSDLLKIFFRISTSEIHFGNNYFCCESGAFGVATTMADSLQQLMPTGSGYGSLYFCFYVLHLSRK